MTAVDCPFCHSHLSATDMAGGWCESCGKRIPPFAIKEAKRSGVWRRPGVALPPVTVAELAAEPASAPADGRRWSAARVSAVFGVLFLVSAGILTSVAFIAGHEGRDWVDTATAVILGGTAVYLAVAGVRMVYSGWKGRAAAK